MQKLILIAHNVRSAHNVGSLLRSADGFGLQKVYFTGYTPYPAAKNDSRLPHLAAKLEHQISKTALGAQNSIAWAHQPDIYKLIDKLRSRGYLIAALEQSKTAQALPDFYSGSDLALIVGREVEGIEPEVLQAVDTILEIPMLGKKESLNVASAAAAALYQLRFGLKR
ncbi:MAG TPA: TrmH family RNA methyltransferase [Candidatus Binatia bacterium]|nr:TrmH family RNA methyltransferase [Candidatus Binatia bacterium]